MGYALFLLVNAALFIRPGEIFTDTAGWPIYLYLILACLICSSQQVLAQLSPQSLAERPVTVCVLGVWVAAILSHLVAFRTYEAREVGIEFGKVILYYLLLVGLLDSWARLRQFLLCLIGLITIVATIAVLEYHQVIDIPSLQTLEQQQFNEETGEYTIIPRLRGTGIFNDPNDICLILSLGTLLALYFYNDHGFGLLRGMWLLPIGLLGYTLKLTQSRGGMLGLLAGLCALVWVRHGWKKAALLGVGAAVGLVALGGRQANIDLADNQDTGQARIQLWVEGIELMKTSPLFGIGANNYADQVGLVAHNSFVHCYTELGFLGGTLFAGAFYVALTRLRWRGSGAEETGEPEVARFRPYMIGILVAYIVAILSLSRPYASPTYLVLGLGALFLHLSGESIPEVAHPRGSKLAGRVCLASCVLLFTLYFGVKLLMRMG